MFIDRAAELAFLNDVTTREHPGPGQFVMLYGRRRVGKTALLRAWAEQSGLPFTYWVSAQVGL
jgi:AAA+ ATPase superfamily predicted ATPase